jgi:S-adenosylmethionine:tRNA ribosyltransferase-isomerase
MVLEAHGDKTNHKVLHRGKIKVNETLLVEDAEVKVLKLLGNGLAEVSGPDLYQLADKYGEVPIPPYLQRDASEIDNLRYQTEFAKTKGSVAAPTASLNMTKELLNNLQEKGVIVGELTLHVGIGTFLPIRTDKVEEHKMHCEYFEIPDETVTKILNAKKNGKKIVAVGTTAARTLEYAANDILTGKKNIMGEADIFIYPGYKFKLVDMLLTNFHAPRSTVLMLAAAFAGWENLRKAYEEAKIEGYRFLSYGDSMVII